MESSNLRVDRPNLKEVVAGHLRAMILSGQLLPGTRVDQGVLSTQLGVSKVPVREALITLESEGLVYTRERRGTYVSTLTRQDVLDHHQIYGDVCRLAAEHAATALTEQQLEELEYILTRLETATSTDEQEQLNFQFHRIINRAGSSRRLLFVLKLLYKTVPTPFFEYVPGWATEAHGHHRKILSALRKKDPVSAGEAMKEHLNDSGQWAIEILQRAGIWDPDAYREEEVAETTRP